MESYWYFTRNNQIPSNRKLIAVFNRGSYALLQYACEVDCDKVENCHFVYLGYGEMSSREVQTGLMREMQRRA